MLSVVMLSVVMLSVIMLSVITLNVIMLSVVMLNVVALQSMLQKFCRGSVRQIISFSNLQLDLLGVVKLHLAKL
jgi:hypothetical protein